MDLKHDAEQASEIGLLEISLRKVASWRRKPGIDKVDTLKRSCVLWKNEI